MWTPKTPEVIDALVTLWRDALADDVEVFDGPAISGNETPVMVWVGFVDTDDTSASTTTVTPEGMNPSTGRERIDVNCSIYSMRGDTDISTARADAFSTLTECGKALASNPTLSNAVLTATVGQVNLEQFQTDRGARAVVSFTVEAEAYTREDT